MDARTRLDQIAQGYQHSIVLLTACKLGVFAALGESSRTAMEVAEELHLDPRGLETILLALAADGFLIQSTGGFSVASEYVPYLLPTSAETLASIMNHNHSCMLRWSRLTEVLKGPGSASGRRRSGTIPRPGGELRDFICGMANISRTSTAEVAAKVDLSGCRRMLDVGGGPATSSIVLAQHNPSLTCVVFDLPEVIEIARDEIEKAGLTDRIETRCADYYKDDFGTGFDLVYISNIIHSMPPEDTAMIVSKAYAALQPGGKVIIKEFFLEDDRTTPNFAAFFSVNMLVGGNGGKSYTLTETKQILTHAGFAGFEVIDIAAASRLLIATKA